LQWQPFAAILLFVEQGMAPVMLPGLITNNVRGFFFIQQFTPPGKKPPQRCTSPVKLAENILRKDLFRNHGLLSVCFLPNSPFNPSAMAMFCQAFYLHKKAAGCYACGQFGRMLPSQQR